MSGIAGSGGPIRALRRLSILVDVQDVATARLTAINGAANKASGSLDEAGESARGASRAFQGIAIAAGVGLFAIQGLARVGASIDRTFSIVQETMNATAGTLREIKETTTDIGRETPKSISQVTSAFEQFAYAGFEADEAMAAMNSTVELAVAGNMDLGEATKTTGQMMNAFGIEADNVNATVASLTSTFANSAANIETLANGFQYAASTMSQLGVSISEVNALLGVAADRGLEGSMAGTALNQAFNKMLGGAQSVEKALGALNMTMDDLTDSEGELLPITDVLEILSGKLEQAQINGAGLQQWLVDMFGQRGARIMGPLIDDTEEYAQKLEESALAQVKSFGQEWDNLEKRDQLEAQILFDTEGDIEERAQMLEEMEDAEVEALAEDAGEFPEDPALAIENLRERYEEGALAFEEVAEMYQQVFGLEEQVADEMAKMTTDEETELDELTTRLEEATTQADLTAAQMDTVAGKLQYLRSSASSLAYTMYTGFAPLLERILDVVIFLTDQFAKMPGVLKAVGAVLLTVTTALAVYTAIGLTTIGVNYAMAASGNVLAASFATTSKGIWLLHTAALALINPKKTLIFTTQYLLRWLSGLSMLLPTLSRNLFATAASSIAMGNYAQAAGHAVRALAVASKALYVVLLPFIKIIAVIAALYLAYRYNILGVRDATHWLYNATLDLLDALGIAIAGIALFKDELGGLVGVLGSAGGSLMSFLGAFNDAWIGFWGSVGDVIYEIAGGITDAFAAAADWIDEFFDLVTGVEDLDDLVDVGSFLKESFLGLEAWIASWFANLGKRIVAWTDGMFDGDWDFSGLIDAGADAIVAFGKGLWNNADTLAKIVAGVVLAAVILPIALLVGGVGLLVQLGGRAIKAFAKGFWNARGDAIMSAVNTVKETAAAIRGTAEWLYNAGVKLIGTFILGLKNAPGSVYDVVKDKLGPLGRLLPESDADEGPLSNLTAAGAAIPETIAKGIMSVRGLIPDSLLPVFDLLLEKSIKPLIDHFHNQFVDAIETVRDAGEDLQEDIDTIIGFAEDLIDKIKDLDRLWPDFGLLDIANFLKGVLADALGKIADKFGDFKEAAKDTAGWFGDLVSGAKDLREIIPDLDLPSLNDAADKLKDLVGIGDDEGDLEEDTGGEQQTNESIQQMSNAAGCIQQLCDAIGQHSPGGGDAAAYLSRTVGGASAAAGPVAPPMAPTGGSTSMRRQNVQYVDDRTLVIEESPQVNVQGSGSSVQRRNMEKAIQNAMRQTRKATLGDMVDFLVTGSPTGLARRTGNGTPPEDEDTDETDGEEPSPGDGIELPEDWDEWSEEEQDQWLDENYPDEDLDPDDIGDPTEDETDGEDGEETDGEGTDGEETDDGGQTDGDDTGTTL